jgi:hypothetical protein
MGQDSERLDPRFETRGLMHEISLCCMFSALAKSVYRLSKLSFQYDHKHRPLT